MSHWIAHVKAYAKKHKIPYGEALIKAKATYKPKKKGKGILDKVKELGNKAVDLATSRTGTLARNMLNKNPKSRPLYPGEKHAVELSGEYKGSSYNYMGPGTQLAKRLARGDPPINEADAIAKTHDIAYSKLGDIKDPEALKEAELKADKEAIKGWAKLENKLPEVKVAIASISAKMAGQLAGKIPWGVYAGKGKRRQRRKKK